MAGFFRKVARCGGFWAKRLTVPPFVANRVIDQWHYIRSEASGTYQFIGPGPNIHHQGRSADNLHRSLKQIVPTSALFWYSGNTNETGRGSLMGYIPVNEDHWPWFLAFARHGDWRRCGRKSKNTKSGCFGKQAKGRKPPNKALQQTGHAIGGESRHYVKSA